MTTHTPPAGMEILTPEWRENNPPHSTTIALDPRVNVWQTFTSEAHIIEAYWTDSRVLFAAPLGTMKAEPDDLALVMAGKHVALFIDQLYASDEFDNAMEWTCNLRSHEGDLQFTGSAKTPNEAIQSALAAWRAGK